MKAVLTCLEPGQFIPVHSAGVDLALLVLEGDGQIVAGDVQEAIWNVIPLYPVVMSLANALRLHCIHLRRRKEVKPLARIPTLQLNPSFSGSPGAALPNDRQ
jgi:hypothetical protein